MISNHVRCNRQTTGVSASPTRPSSRPRGRRWIRASMPAILGLLVSLAFPPGSIAIENVQGETWTLPTLGSNRVSLVFDAIVSNRDWSQGIAFDIALREGEGEPRALVRYSTVAAVPNLPDPGQPLTFRVEFDVTCAVVNGVVTGTPVEAYVRFCTNGHGIIWHPLTDAGHEGSLEVTGAFGLVVLDENGTPGPNPTSATALGCAGASSAPVLTAATPLVVKPARPRIADNHLPGTIGVYFDPMGTVCQGTISPGAIDTVYVLAKLGESDDSRCGIEGAEFRFTGLPASWQVSPVLNHELLGIGNPFDEGVTVVGTRCHRPSNGVVLLYTVLVRAGAEVSDVTFGIQSREPPTNSQFECPLLLSCDDPVFTQICVQGQACFVNSTIVRKCPTITAVQPSTWSQIKTLFR